MTAKVELSKKQQEIVFSDSGPLLVKASAGSGKTRVLTERIRYVSGQTKRKILAITFTNKAAEEIKERLKDMTGIEKQLFIGTFHSFCKHVLENHGNVIGLSKMPHIFEDESDRLELIEKAIQQTPSYSLYYKKQDTKSQQKICYDTLNFVSRIKRKLVSVDKELPDQNDEDITLLYTTYQEILISQNAIDFDDLLLLTYRLFIEYPNVSALYRRSYQYICIDEAQDLNNSQYNVLLALTGSEHKNVMMVGDPNQSIFAFNGSSPEFMTNYFVSDFDPRIIEMRENYRSSKAVLRAAEKILPGSGDIINTVKKGIFEIFKMEEEDKEAEWIYNKIVELIKLGKHDDIEGEITYEKIVVLARNKYVFNQLEKILGDNKIPFYYKMTPGAIKFESNAMQIFDLALRVKLNPQDSLHWNRLLELSNIHSNGKINLQNLITRLNPGIEKRVLETVIELNDDGRNFKNSLENFKTSIINDPGKHDDEKMMLFNDTNEVLEHWRNYAKKTDNTSLHQFKNAMALGQTHPLTQRGGITFSTVHTMKGQENDIVFLMGMDDGTFPDYRAIRKGGIEMTQEKNNLYVAFTRAKRFLYVTWPKKRRMPWGDYAHREISRFLKCFNN